MWRRASPEINSRKRHFSCIADSVSVEGEEQKEQEEREKVLRWQCPRGTEEKTHFIIMTSSLSFLCPMQYGGRPKSDSQVW